MRLHGKTAVIDNGFVHIPETAPWLAEYLHELTVFANGKHDDQADSAAQFLDWFKKPFPGQGLYEYYRRRAQQLEEQRKPQPVKTAWAIGSMEWQAEQKKAGRTAASALEPYPSQATQRQDATTARRGRGPRVRSHLPPPASLVRT